MIININLFVHQQQHPSLRSFYSHWHMDAYSSWSPKFYCQFFPRMLRHRVRILGVQFNFLRKKMKLWHININTISSSDMPYSLYPKLMLGYLGIPKLAFFLLLNIHWVLENITYCTILYQITANQKTSYWFY